MKMGWICPVCGEVNAPWLLGCLGGPHRKAAGSALTNSPSASELYLADLGALLRALGMGDHARSQSPHEVMLEAIEEVKHLKAMVP